MREDKKEAISPNSEEASDTRKQNDFIHCKHCHHLVLKDDNYCSNCGFKNPKTFS